MYDLNGSIPMGNLRHRYHVGDLATYEALPYDDFVIKA